jgi:hypothetical protein
LNAKKSKIICISGGNHCNQEMARQPLLIRAIQQEMVDAGYPSMNIKVEWLEFNHFLEDNSISSKIIPKTKTNVAGSSAGPITPGGAKKTTTTTTTATTTAELKKGRTSSHVCPVCSRELGSKQSLQQSAGNFQCGFCDREFSSLDSLEQHCQATGHLSRGTKPATQGKQGKAANTSSALTVSAAVPAPARVPAPIPASGQTAGKSVNGKSENKNMPAENRDRKTSTLNCPICNREFGSEQSLEQH